MLHATLPGKACARSWIAAANKLLSTKKPLACPECQPSARRLASAKHGHSVVQLAAAVTLHLPRAQSCEHPLIFSAASIPRPA